MASQLWRTHKKRFYKFLFLKIKWWGRGQEMHTSPRTEILFIYNPVVTASYQASVMRPVPVLEFHTWGLIMSLQLYKINFC